MTITATVITIANADLVERDVFIRGEAFGKQRSLRHLDAIMRKHDLFIINMVAYQQPTFEQSIHYHLTGEAI